MTPSTSSGRKSGTYRRIPARFSCNCHVKGGEIMDSYTSFQEAFQNCKGGCEITPVWKLEEEQEGR